MRGAPDGAFKRFAKGKTLPQGGLCPPEDGIYPGSPPSKARWGSQGPLGESDFQAQGLSGPQTTTARMRGAPDGASKRFAEGKTLPQGGLCQTED